MTTLEIVLAGALAMVWLLGGLTVDRLLTITKSRDGGALQFVVCVLAWPLLQLYVEMRG